MIERRRTASPGFTLIELLVVIAIISVLAGLLLPAIQAARESARRSQCSNQLRQLALATLQFEAAQGALPAGSVTPPTEGAASVSWRVQVLPHLEEQELYDELGPLANGLLTNTAPTFGATKPTIGPPSVFRCPSLPDPPDSPALAGSSYAGVAGSGATNDGVKEVQEDRYGPLYIDGVYYPDSWTRTSQISDGTSSTLALGERVYMLDWSPWTVGQSWRLGDEFNGVEVLRRVLTMSTKNVRFPLNGDRETFGYFRFDNDWSPAKKVLLENDLYFGSVHQGGAYFSMADGSVHFLDNDINFSLYKDLATRAGGEVTDAGY